VGAVGRGDLLRVDAADRQVLQRAVQRLGQVRGGVGGAQVHRQAAPGQFHRHGRRQRGLADAALAHQHDQAVAVRRDVVHQRGKARGDERGLGRIARRFDGR
jgi:hypothetical protein